MSNPEKKIFELVKTPEQKELESLANQLYHVDLKIRQSKAILERLDGTDKIVADGMTGIEQKPLNKDEVVDPIKLREEMATLTNEVKKIIEKMITIDSTVRLPSFDEYGF